MPDYPAIIDIGWRALHHVLGNRAKSSGASTRLGITVTRLDDDGAGVSTTFSDGSHGRFDIVVGADGLYSTTREMIFGALRVMSLRLQEDRL